MHTRRSHTLRCLWPRNPGARGPSTRRIAVSDVAVRTGDSAGVWRERDAELISPAYSRYSDLVVDSALGAHLHTVDGRDVLDFACGIGVTNLGHRHPPVVRRSTSRWPASGTPRSPASARRWSRPLRRWWRSVPKGSIR